MKLLNEYGNWTNEASELSNKLCKEYIAECEYNWEASSVAQIRLDVSNMITHLFSCIIPDIKSSIYDTINKIFDLYKEDPLWSLLIVHELILISSEAILLKQIKKYKSEK